MKQGAHRRGNRAAQRDWSSRARVGRKRWAAAWPAWGVLLAALCCRPTLVRAADGGALEEHGRGGVAAAAGSGMALAAKGGVRARGTADRETVPEDKGSEPDDRVDPMNFDVSVGYSYLWVLLGHMDIPGAADLRDMSPEERSGLVETAGEPLVDVVDGMAKSTGAALWLRLSAFSMGMHLTFSSLEELSTMTLLAEFGLRFQNQLGEVHFGVGMGGGWLYGVPKARANEDSGLAMRCGLGASLFAHRSVALGLTVEAVGLFLGGEGISLAQVTGFSVTESDHPVGIQIPIMLTLSMRT